MKKLFLHELIIHPYFPNKIRAFIYYGDKENPLDHLNQPIDIFYQMPFKLQQHLESEILPQFTQSFENSKYRVTCVDFINMAPHPFFSLERRDKLKISKYDIVAIKKELNDAINLIYKNSMNKVESKVEAKKELDLLCFTI